VRPVLRVPQVQLELVVRPVMNPIMMKMNQIIHIMNFDL
jgi:hypothetical protein